MVRFGSGNEYAPATDVVSGGASAAFHCVSDWPAPATLNQEFAEAMLSNMLPAPVMPARLALEVWRTSGEESRPSATMLLMNCTLDGCWFRPPVYVATSIVVPPQS